jgi:Terminase large subunit, T4likevirus-type, N-terminal
VPRRRNPNSPRGNPDEIPLGRPSVRTPQDPPLSGGGNPPPHAPNDDPPPFEPIIPEVPTDGISDKQKAKALLGRAALAELVARKREALKLYEPSPIQEVAHQCNALIRLMLGGNRSGKTTWAATEVSRAVTGQDPWGKWPTSDGNFIIVGKDGSHIGKVMYPRLFLQRRNFLLIRDLETGMFRSWRPWDAIDQERKDEARPAGPLIPRRFVKEVSWYSKKDNIPRVAKLVNGWELYFYSSEADPPGGFPADGAWFDEEILRGSEWTEEVMARLVDRQGRFIWSATPQNATEELFNLHVQAQEEAGSLNPGVQEWIIHIDQNAYMPAESREKFKERMRRRGEESYQVRVEGKFAIEGFRVYPEYGDIHRCKRFAIPDEWTIWVIVDPGRQVCASLFVAVPDPRCDERHRGHIYFFDELYIKNADARQFGRNMKRKLDGRMPRGYIIDKQEGRKHDTGSGRSIEEQYSRQLKRRRLQSIDTGYSFHAGPPDPAGNREAMREWLTPDDAGHIKLVVFDDLLNFDREMKNYHFKRQNGIPTDQPLKKHDHLCDCAGYAAGLDLRWKKPPLLRKREDLAVVRLFEKKKAARIERERGNRRGYHNIGNSGGSDV